VRALEDEYAAPNLPTLPTLTSFLIRVNYFKNGKNGGHEDLRTDSALRRNFKEIPQLQQMLSNGTIKTRFNTVTADADKNGSQTIDQVIEWAELRNDDPMLWAMYEGTDSTRLAATVIVNNLYQLIRQNKQIYFDLLTATTAEGNNIKAAVFKGIPNTPPLGNDSLVTLESGRGKGFFENITSHKVPLGAGVGKNHSSIADAYVAGLVVPWFIEADQYSGDLK
jgi:hypothetical protein